MSESTKDSGAQQKSGLRIPGFAQLQRLGKSLMLPIAVLPAAGILLRLGQDDLLGRIKAPVIGPFFSNTTSERVEKELVVLVTPYIIEPIPPGQVPPGPGDEVNEPNDLEFFLLNRIEGRTGQDARSTTSYDDPFHLIRHSLVERKYLIGPSGYLK